jgi:hypothetical protein
MNKDLDGIQEKMGAIPEGIVYRDWRKHSQFQSVKDIAGFYTDLGAKRKI